MNAKEDPAVRRLLDGLSAALGERLCSVVLYGSAARGDFQKKASDINLLVVVDRLDPGAIEAASAPLRRWVRAGQPMPRIFPAGTIAESADVFPIEFLDIRDSRVVLHGTDPLEGLEIHTDHLRLQCERELREKMMRLEEAYAEAHANRRALERLLTGSYGTFVALFRGCLHLPGGEAPVHNAEVVEAFCSRAGLDPAPFEEIARLRDGEGTVEDLRRLFARYHEELSKAVHSVNRFEPGRGETGS